MRLIIGFIRLVDCASLVVAAERGFASAEGLELTLVPETAWANIRDRLLVGHFDAAHLLGPMAVASSLGIGHVRMPLIAPFALGLGGNAITVSTSLWQRLGEQGGAASADPTTQGLALRAVVSAREHARLAPLTFGMVYPFSCHNYLLRYWLAASGVDPDREVQLVVIPPPLMADALQEGHIDGFCVGEPWNSVAVEAGAGTIVMPTTAIWGRSPEKVLACRGDWAERHPEPLGALLRALYRASLWCREAANHSELARLLAEARYLGISAQVIHRALTGRLVLAPGSEVRHMPGFYVPGGEDATFPWVSHAFWFYSQMIRWGQIRNSPEDLASVRATYRPDLYRAALASLGADLPDGDVKTEQLFDGALFEPAPFLA
jgi:NitT/TauT family transport system ATP-binding protein